MKTTLHGGKLQQQASKWTLTWWAVNLNPCVIVSSLFYIWNDEYGILHFYTYSPIRQNSGCDIQQVFVFISNDIKMIWHVGIYIYNIHTVQVIQHFFPLCRLLHLRLWLFCSCSSTAVLLNSYIAFLNRRIQPGILLMHFSMWHYWSVTEHTHAWFHHFAFTHFQSELHSVMLYWWQYVVLCVRYGGGVKELGSSIRHVGVPVTCLLWSLADHTDQFLMILLLSLHCCLHLSTSSI